MIDKSITNFQENIIHLSNSFVYRNTGPFSGSTGTDALFGFENRIVMVLAIGFTSLVDYLKFPLAAIEELVKGILLTPTIPFGGLKCCIKHLEYSLHYLTLIFSKLILGTCHDLSILKVSLMSPHKIPVFIPASYYGCKATYNKYTQSDEEKNYPSIYLT